MMASKSYTTSTTLLWILCTAYLAAIVPVASSQNNEALAKKSITAEIESSLKLMEVLVLAPPKGTDMPYIVDDASMQIINWYAASPELPIDFGEGAKIIPPELGKIEDIRTDTDGKIKCITRKKKRRNSRLFYIWFAYSMANFGAWLLSLHKQDMLNDLATPATGVSSIGLNSGFIANILIGLLLFAKSLRGLTEVTKYDVTTAKKEARIIIHHPSLWSKISRAYFSESTSNIEMQLYDKSIEKSCHIQTFHTDQSKKPHLINPPTGDESITLRAAHARLYAHLRWEKYQPDSGWLNMKDALARYSHLLNISLVHSLMNLSLPSSQSLVSAIRDDEEEVKLLRYIINTQVLHNFDTDEYHKIIHLRAMQLLEVKQGICLNIKRNEQMSLDKFELNTTDMTEEPHMIVTKSVTLPIGTRDIYAPLKSSDSRYVALNIGGTRTIFDFEKHASPLPEFRIIPKEHLKTIVKTLKVLCKIETSEQTFYQKAMAVIKYPYTSMLSLNNSLS